MAEETSKPRKRIIDTNAQQLGRMYAKALFEVAEEQGISDDVLEELDAVIDEVLDPHPQFDAVLSSPRVEPEQKADLLDKTLGGRISDVLLRFLKVVGSRQRLDCLRAIRQEAHVIHDALRHRVHIELTAPVEIDDSQLERVRQRVEERGMNPYFTTRVKPELLGGLVIRVGDSVYDSSLATQLANLKHQMIDRSVHEIQSGRDRFSNSSGD
ncbi:MAG: ATP synthase F1 subunit delta [Planctomycetales bacterium]